jgi:hypothetical protein
MRSILVLLAIAGGTLAAALVVVLRSEGQEPISLPQRPMPGRLLVGAQDDPSFRWAADRSAMLDRARDANVALLRTVVSWRDAAPARPAAAADPFDPAYRLDDVDDLVRSSQQRGIELLITIWGTPEWANGGESPNRPPRDPRELEGFAAALADRYSGRHPGYPAVRLFSAWNEPNLEQFLAPQFDGRGRSVGPALYATLARAVYDGVKRGNPDALVAIGETSPRGHDVQRNGRVQDSHSPPGSRDSSQSWSRSSTSTRGRSIHTRHERTSRPPSPCAGHASAWATSSASAPRSTSGSGGSRRRSGSPSTRTRRSRRSRSASTPRCMRGMRRRLSSSPRAIPASACSLWFIFRDRADGLWQSGLLSEDGVPKPALESLAAAAERLDARNPVLPESVEVARVPALELAYHVPAGTPIDVSVDGAPRLAVTLERDGWLEVPVEDRQREADELGVRATDAYGHSVLRIVRLGSPETIEVD